MSTIKGDFFQANFKGLWDMLCLTDPTTLQCGYNKSEYNDIWWTWTRTALGNHLHKHQPGLSATEKGRPLP